MTVAGNTFVVGKNDDNGGEASPKYGLVIKRLKGCIISSNKLFKGYLEEDIHDLGGHGEQVLIKDNVSCPVSKSDSLSNGNLFLHW